MALGFPCRGSAALVAGLIVWPWGCHVATRLPFAVYSYMSWTVSTSWVPWGGISGVCGVGPIGRTCKFTTRFYNRLVRGGSQSRRVDLLRFCRNLLILF